MNTAQKSCLPLTVYYDKSCPLCATEMHALRDRNPDGLRLEDCSAWDFDCRKLACEGLTREELMTRIHARRPGECWLVGVDAFEAVYAAAGLKGAARFWGNPRLRPVLERIYPWIARNRQALSRLGLHRLVGMLLSRAGERSSRRA
jgi:predicted DCC family thiol-disulfide oxidoreductase YuxK